MKFTSSDVYKLGSILGVWAHPDDEVFASGALIASAVNNGQRVVLIIATNGEAGNSANETQWPKSDLANTRKGELTQGLGILGVEEYFVLDYPDGRLSVINPETSVTKIIELLGDFIPDTVVSFEEQGITGHDDHKSVHDWANQLSKHFGSKFVCAIENKEFYEKHGRELDQKYNVYFKTEIPRCVARDSADICLCADVEACHKKFLSLEAHSSQTSKMLASAEDIQAIKQMCECECYEVIE